MSIKIMNEAWDMRIGDPTTKLILMCLADHANEQDRTCWPALKLIAQKCECSERTVRRHIAELEEKGHLQKRNRTGDSTLYFVLPANAQGTLTGKEFSYGGGDTSVRGADKMTAVKGDRGCGHNYDRGCGHSCPPNHQEPSRTVNISSDFGFREFWIAYDLKVGKKKCLDAWKRKRLADKADAIISAAKAYVKALGDDRKFQKHPLTWLNGEHWEDEVVTQPGKVTETPLKETSIQTFVQYDSMEWRELAAYRETMPLPTNTARGYGRWFALSEVEAAMKLEEKFNA